MNVVVVIPAYNAGGQIQDVLARLENVHHLPIFRVFVIDDGSTDDTADRVRQTPFVRCPLELLQRARNGGYGAAIKDGLRAAVNCGADVVACVHADGQYSPEALPDLLEALSRRQLDLLQGSRIASGTAKSGGMPLYKRLGNALFNRLENRTFRLSMTDYHSGYLVYGRRALRLPHASFSDSFDFDLEVIASARARGLSVGEAPIPTHYGDEVSHLNPLSYAARVLRVLYHYRQGHYAA